MKKHIVVLLLLIMVALSGCSDKNIGELPAQLTEDDNENIRIEFTEDSTYTLSVGDESLSGSFTAAKYADGCIAVTCSTDTSTKFGKAVSYDNEFYIFRSADGVWKYYGQEYKDLSFGKLLVQNENERKYFEVEQISDCSTARTDGEYLGVEQSFDYVSISQGETANSIVFSEFWYRTYSIDDCSAEVYGNYAAFDYVEDDGDETFGLLKFEGDRDLSVMLLSSELNYIENGTYKYEFKTTDEMAAESAEIAKADLTKNDSSNGWENTDEGIFLYFNADGTVKCYFDRRGYDDMPYDGFTWKYSIDGDTITINGDKYKYISSVGSSAEFYYTFQAVGKDTYDIAGDYYFGTEHKYPRQDCEKVKAKDFTEWHGGCWVDVDSYADYLNGDSENYSYILFKNGCIQEVWWPTSAMGKITDVMMSQDMYEQEKFHYVLTIHYDATEETNEHTDTMTVVIRGNEMYFPESDSGLYKNMGNDINEALGNAEDYIRNYRT